LLLLILHMRRDKVGYIYVCGLRMWRDKVGTLLCTWRDKAGIYVTIAHVARQGGLCQGLICDHV